MKLNRKLMLLVLITMSMLILQGVFGILKMSNMADDTQQNLQTLKTENDAMVAIKSAETRFKTQVQEWKNILIRGNDPERFDKYLGQFEKEEAKVHALLTNARDSMKKIGFTTDDIDAVMEDHLTLGKKYRDALKQFNKEDPNAGKIVDKLVEGVDRPASKGMTALVENIEKHFNQSASSQNERAQTGFTSALYIFITIIAFGVAVSLIAAILILRNITQQLGGDPSYALKVTRRIAQGDLTTPVETIPGDTTSLLAAMQQMQASISKMIQEVHTIAEEVSNSATQVNIACRQVSEGSQKQNDEASATASTVEEMTVSINHVATNAEDARAMAIEAGDLSKQGSQVMESTISGIHTIAQSFSNSTDIVRNFSAQSSQISAIANVIKEIADQTNLLALNAAIEAARAGEQGRGFAVVADEVRKLAERTAKSTREIATTIESIQSETRNALNAMTAGGEQVAEGVELATKAGESMTRIETSASKVLNITLEISDALREQSTASSQIANKVENISNMTEENTAATSEIVSASEHLEKLANRMKSAIGRFKLLST